MVFGGAACCVWWVWQVAMGGVRWGYLGGWGPRGSHRELIKCLSNGKWMANVLVTCCGVRWLQGCLWVVVLALVCVCKCLGVCLQLVVGHVCAWS